MTRSPRVTAWRRSDSAFIRASRASCICASNRTKDWSRRLFARYIARSALRSSWSAVSSPVSLIAMPVEAPRASSRPSRTNGADSARRTRSAAQMAPSSASGPVTRMANSSPPRRATRSPGRTELVSRLATMPEQLVTDVVALRVVDRLEAVQVQEEHADLGAVQRHLQRGLDLRPEQRPVRQPGEPVGERLQGQLLLEPAALGDVAGVEHQPADVGVVDQRGHRRLGVAPRAGLGPDREVEGDRAARAAGGRGQRRVEPAAVAGAQQGGEPGADQQLAGRGRGSA